MHRSMNPLLARPLLILAAFAMAAGQLPAAADNIKTGETKTVVELFTSQGCSSCPPADKVLGELAKNDRVVALSLPVDYWDYLGWRDTLALHAHSMRQKAYADARGDRQVYTPQVVINGVAQAIGSDRPTIMSAIATAEANRVPAIPVTLKKNGDKIDVVIGAGTGMRAPVFLLTVTSETAVAIGRGENRGKTVSYYNAVRTWRRLGEWNGAPMRVSVPLSEMTGSGADGVVVIVQAGSVEVPGPIRGAAHLSLH
ncbi:MAG TPA: DUF1223 domain-containing protein [Xanthobacteraceae bacterium]|jgi:hypothetical protein